MTVEVKLRELPENYRIKLTEEQQKEFWNNIREKGTIKEYSKQQQIPLNQLYNLKNKDIAYPVKLITQTFSNREFNTVLFKGPHKSNFAKSQFPIQIPEELLTRIKHSVKVNKEGTPHYITYEEELANRFRELLKQKFNIETRTYRNQGRYELRYPKYLHDLLNGIDFEEDLCAKIDEAAEIEENNFKLPSEKINFKQVNCKLYSREKKLALALHRKDSKQVAEIISQETEKINKLINN